MAQKPRFEDVTETTGVPLSREGAEMMATRYVLARGLATGKRVLELGCAAGQGFGLIAARAVSLVGGDYSQTLLRSARRHYGDRVPVVRLSAERLPFASGIVDLVVFFEASYYVPDMGAALQEIARVLAPGGSVLLANANPERPDFIHSPHSFKYHTADEFRSAVSQLGFAVTVEAAFEVQPRAEGVTRLGAGVLSWSRRVFQHLGLVPRTLEGRARLKRLVYGPLLQTPAELLDGFATPRERHSVLPGPVTGYKVIYVQGTKPLPQPSANEPGWHD